MILGRTRRVCWATSDGDAVKKEAAQLPTTTRRRVKVPVCFRCTVSRMGGFQLALTLGVLTSGAHALDNGLGRVPQMGWVLCWPPAVCLPAGLSVCPRCPLPSLASELVLSGNFAPPGVAKMWPVVSRNAVGGTPGTISAAVQP